MYSGKLVFAQLMEHLPLHTFRRYVQRYPSKYPTKTFSHLDQFLCMTFAQLTYRESLRDIETCLRAHRAKLYHLGIRGNIAKSTLADANEQRDWHIYEDFAISLIQIARKLYASDSFAVELEQTAYALDTTTIDLCLSVFPWARFRSTKAAVKMHTLLDLRGNIPTFIHITDGKMHEVNVLDILIPEAGSFYIMDRGFTDFARWFTLLPAAGVLYHPGQIQFTLSSRGRTPRRQVHGAALRSDHYIDLPEGQQGLPTASAMHQVLRCRTRQASGISDQQLRFACANHRSALPLPLAGRTILQMDQTAPQDQAVLRHHRECSQDTNMDRHRGLCFGRHSEKTAQFRGFTLHNPTDFEPDSFRENTARSIT